MVGLKSGGQCWFLLGLEMLLLNTRKLFVLVGRTARVRLYMRNVCCAGRLHKMLFGRSKIAEM